MTTREIIFPVGRQAPYEQHRCSAAIRSCDLLFVSGQVGCREDGSPEPDFDRQVDRAFANLIAVQQAAGCGLADIVDVATFHTNPEVHFEAVRAAKNQRFPEAP